MPGLRGRLDGVGGAIVHPIDVVIAEDCEVGTGVALPGLVGHERHFPWCGLVLVKTTSAWEG